MNSLARSPGRACRAPPPPERPLPNPSAPPAGLRLTDRVARRLRLVPSPDPFEARFQPLIATALVAAAILLVVQSAFVALTEARSTVLAIRLAALGVLTVSVLAAFPPLRRGRTSAAVTRVAIGGALHALILASAFGLRHQPHLLLVATAPAMLLAVFGSVRELVVWGAVLLAAIAIGLFAPVQDPLPGAAGTHFSAIVLTMGFLAVVLAEHRRGIVADAAEATAREAQLAARNAELHAVILERDRLVDEREEGQRLEAMGRLAGGVAHDFNNVLAAIQGHVDVLRTEYPDAADDLDEVTRGVQRAAGLTAQLLAFARRQPSAPTPLDLAALARGLAPMLDRVLGGRVALRLHAPAPVVVEADRTQMEQVIVNLVVNARDALPDGGTVRLSVVADPPRDREPAMARLEVTDDGVGMDAATRARIFEPFFTTKPDHHGAGLGLATVYGIVRRHDGMIGVESAPGAGSTFRVTLPLLADAALAACAAAPPAVDTPQESLVVLLVEDDTSVRTVLEKLLVRAGCTVIAAPDGAQALLELSLLPVRFDVLITDMRMPGASGAEVAAAYLSRRAHGRVVLVSGDHDPEEVRRVVPEGDVVFLAKPFTAEALIAAVAGRRSDDARDGLVAAPAAQRPNQ